MFSVWVGYVFALEIDAAVFVGVVSGSYQVRECQNPHFAIIKA